MQRHSHCRPPPVQHPFQTQPCLARSHMENNPKQHILETKPPVCLMAILLSSPGMSSGVEGTVVHPPGCRHGLSLQPQPSGLLAKTSLDSLPTTGLILRPVASLLCQLCTPPPNTLQHPSFLLCESSFLLIKNK